MTQSDDTSVWGLMGGNEIDISKSFMDQGYVISDVSDKSALDLIRQSVLSAVPQDRGHNSTTAEEVLNGFHNSCDLSELNDFRLDLIHSLNIQPSFRRHYFSIARDLLYILVGSEIAMQRRVNLSIQMPNDSSSLLPVHADVWSGDSPYEVVVWTPLVDCYKTKSMFILPPAKTQQLHHNFKEFNGKSSEDIYQEIEHDLVWLNVPYGKTVIFNQNLPHGNRVNVESETRWSLNCRFKGLFTPYGEKKLGEFFTPITLRAASRIGMTYRYPTFD